MWSDIHRTRQAPTVQRAFSHRCATDHLVFGINSHQCSLPLATVTIRAVKRMKLRHPQCIRVWVQQTAQLHRVLLTPLTELHAVPAQPAGF